jgi:hypothetical protein
MADSDFIYPPVEGSICYKMGCDEKAIGALENWANEKIGEDYADYIPPTWLCEKHLIEQYKEYHHGN